jgi:hypothetical protein
MGFFSFLKYTFIIFAAHLATSCCAPFENHCFRETRRLPRGCCIFNIWIRFIPFQGCYTVGMWEMLPTFQRYILPPSSETKYARSLNFYVYVGSFFEKQRGKEGCLASPLISTQVSVYTQKREYFTRFDSEDGGSMYFRNFVIIAHTHAL